MLRISPSKRRTKRPSGFRVLAACASTAVLGACSADITRFDSPLYGLSGSEAPGNAYPSPPDPLRRNAGGPVMREEAPGYVPTAAEPSSRGGVVVSALPSAEPVRERPYAAPAPARYITPPAQPTARGEQIEVRQGDSIYALAKRHRVSIAELMRVNGLENPNIRPGQKLYLPEGASARVKAKSPRPRDEVASATGSLTAAPSGWNATHTVRSGESLYAIARMRGTTVQELQRVNGIADPRKVRPATVLKVPGEPSRAGEVGYTALPSATRAPAARQVGEDAPSFIPAANRPRVINPQVAAADPREGAPDVAPLAAGEGDRPAVRESGAVKRGTAARFRWPVQGRIIAGFGPGPNGQHNDGINVAVPLGTEVLAAEAGVVAYAGNELKGYGNLVLVRHDHGWVTAYAHNDRLLVARGDRVKRGQPIARAGRTGTVDQPQVHFEVRQGALPVDPTPHMERM